MDKLSLHDYVELNKSEEIGMTYTDLKFALELLTPEQLQQRVMLLPPHPTGKKFLFLLEPVISIGTVEDLCHVDGEIANDTRSDNDFKHHPEQVVLTRDECCFSEDGDNFYEAQEDGTLVGNNSGKIID